MERKRKLPARAAARVEQVAKRRHSTPRERSETPAPPQPVEEPPPPPPPPLPKSVQAGKPLPTVDEPQLDDLSSKEYQSITESGVLTESLARSRQKWMQEGLFEKYWTKPHKRKGVTNEDPKNPPKESMTKVGTVTITIEPHIVEATMYAVKDPKPRVQPQQNSQSHPPPRPILQYGPPNGTMPSPPAAIKSATSSPAPEPAVVRPMVASPVQNVPQATQTPPKPQLEQSPITQSDLARPAPMTVGNTAHSGLSYPQRPPSVPPSSSPLAATQPLSAAPPRPQSQRPPGHLAAPAQAPPAQSANVAARPQPAPNPPVARSPAPSKPGAPAQPNPPAAKTAANDPVIALLAQRASGDSELRDLMKRVAIGQAKEGELAHFQKIIDQLNAEYKRSGGQQGPSADRLLVDGRTVKYFADEVRTILDIVLASNPNQKSTDLRPPPRSDALVVLLVKKALEDTRTRDMIKRIAEGKPGFTDSTDLKEVLDKLHRDAKALPKQTTAATPAKQPLPVAIPNGMQNGHARPLTAQGVHPNQQALRSKGPPPSSKPDISAVVFDFGTGDRYLFPKFSILEFLPTASGQQVIASFLIVRKGSTSEYGGNPELDYYQPISIRIQTQTGRYLENLARVVAPQDEVRRYMDDVMDNMTRAEYVLLAMRLPRASKEAGEKDGSIGGGHDDPKTNGSTPQPGVPLEATAPPKPSVLWGASASAEKQSDRSRSGGKRRDTEEESQAQYEKLINSVAAKETEF